MEPRTQTRDVIDVGGMDAPPNQGIQTNDPPRQEARRAEVVRPVPPVIASGQSRVVSSQSPEQAALFGALARAQGMFLEIERTREARIVSNKGTYAYEYETLADVIAATKDGLSQNELCVTQEPGYGTTGVTIKTTLGHSSGQWRANELTVPIDSQADFRAVGGGMTYLQRYTRKAILGLAALFDDDAEHATEPKRDLPRPSERQPQAERTAPPPSSALREEPAPTRAAVKSQAPPPADPASAPAFAILRTDILAEVREHNGAFYPKLQSGYMAGTKDKDMGAAAKTMIGKRVHLYGVPVPDGAKPNSVATLKQIMLAPEETR